MEHPRTDTADERRVIADALYRRMKRSLEDGGYHSRFVREVARERRVDARDVSDLLVDEAARALADWFADDALALFAPDCLDELAESAAFANVSDL